MVRVMVHEKRRMCALTVQAKTQHESVSSIRSHLPPVMFSEIEEIHDAPLRRINESPVLRNRCPFSLSLGTYMHFYGVSLPSKRKKRRGSVCNGKRTTQVLLLVHLASSLPPVNLPWPPSYLTSGEPTFHLSLPPSLSSTRQPLPPPPCHHFR